MATTTPTPRAEALAPGTATRPAGKEPRYYLILTIRYGILIIMTIFFLGPFVMALLGSFKTTQEVLAWPPTFLPTAWRAQNYVDVWNVLADANGNSYFPRWVLNSLILASSITLAQLFFCSLAGFAFARLDFRGKGFVFAAMMSTLMIPGMVLIIPQYQILNALHLINTYGAIIVPNLTSAAMIFMLTQFFRSIPKDLDEAAWIDGAGIFTTYWRIILPLARPALITLALLSFQGVWNNFLTPLVFLTSPEMYPLTVGLAFLKGQYGAFYNVVLAGAMFNTIPMVLLFLIFSRFYVQGATYRGVKAEPGRRGRAPGPLRLAVTRTVQDWYYGLIPFAALNFVWLLCVLTVVAGPPATAALLGVARDAALGVGAEPSNFFCYLRHTFWQAWKLGLVTLLGSLILVGDLGYYTAALRGNPFLLSLGTAVLLLALVVWLAFLLLAWPLLVNQPAMGLRDVLRNAAILTLRVPGANLGLALLVIVLTVLSVAVGIILALALAAFVSLLAQHYLQLQAPVLANWPPRPGTVARPAEAPE